MLTGYFSDELFRKLNALHGGSLTLTTPDGKNRVFGESRGIHAKMNIYDWRVIPDLILKGDNGLAQSYQDGLWETDNLQNLLSLGMINEQSLKKFMFGNTLYQFIAKISYFLQGNSIRGSRRNIHAHYDLGNEFYKLWLDQGMTYSSALFKSENESLNKAQDNKYDAILDRLNSNSGTVLEIGCGWGGFAQRSLDTKDFSIKGITLSNEQHSFAKERLGKNADIVLEDYRQQKGTFDNIVSIEMFEAVGEKYWPTYFNKISSLLKRGGKAVIQTITIADDKFKQYRSSSDFIRSSIFPGGMLPSPSRFNEEALNAGLRINDEFHFGKDYARTLAIWLENFDHKISEVKSLGFDDRFIRLWRFYLAACIAAFDTGRTNVMHVEMQHA